MQANVLLVCICSFAPLSTGVSSWGYHSILTNVRKCLFITYINLFLFNYTIHNIPLLTVENLICDLGFHLFPTLCHWLHIEEICCKASSSKVQASEDIKKSILLIGALTFWIRLQNLGLLNIYTAKGCVMLEKVQRKFLWVVHFLFKTSHVFHTTIYDCSKGAKSFYSSWSSSNY